MHTNCNNIKDYAHSTIAPVLTQYVSWILKHSCEKGIKKLYFLARDGYVLREIAETLVKQYNLDIECRYLYCSRYSLRTSSYHILDKAETEKYIFLGAMQISLSVIFQRCDFDENQKNAIMEKLNLTEPEKKLSAGEFDSIRKELVSEPMFWNFVFKNSKSRYDRIIQYFNQENVFDSDFVVVDSGWTGSMQRSLRQLLQSADFNHNISGFYFGMFNSPLSDEDGNYHSYYFDKNRYKTDKIMFNNNLLECMLSAPHGMTVDFKIENDTVKPVFKEKRDKKELDLVNQQIEGILEWLNKNINTSNCLKDYTYEQSHKICSKILRRAMTKPSVEEVKILSQFNFCDDSTEDYFYSLAETVSYKDLNTRLLIYRLFRKLTKKFIKSLPYKDYVWFYSALADKNPVARWFYRMNEFLWEYIRLGAM